MTQIKFGTPKDVTNQGYDGVKIKFPFQVIEPRSGALKDKVTHHCIEVDIVRTLLTTRGFTRSDYDAETVRKHLFEYARKAANKSW